MTREEAIEILHFQTFVVDFQTGKALEMAISALRQQEHPQWISVNDRMPAQTDPAQKVLFIKKTGGVFIGCYYKATDYDKFSGWYSMGIRIDNVTHWMPLPEPTEEGTVCT